MHLLWRLLFYALIETNLCNSQSQLFRKYCFPKFLKWTNQFQAFCKSHWGRPVRNNTTWYEWYTFLNDHPKTMVSFSDIGFSSCKITWYNYWFLKTIFQNETSYLFKMIVIIASFWHERSVKFPIFPKILCFDHLKFMRTIKCIRNVRFGLHCMIVFHFLWVHQVSQRT